MSETGAQYRTTARRDATGVGRPITLRFMYEDGGWAPDMMSWIRDMILRDGKSQKRASSSPQNGDALFRKYVENSPVALMVANREGLYVDGNPAAECLFGYPMPELLNRHVLTMVLEEYRDEAGEHFRRVSTDGHAECELPLKRKDGQVIWILILAARLSDDRILGYCFDVTARRRAEDLVRLQSAALQAAANAIAIADTSGRIEWINPAYTALTGYDLSDAIGHTHAELAKSGEQGTDFYQRLWSTIKSGRVWQGELINRRKDGTTYHEEMTITPVCDAQGAIRHFVAIKQDITERKKLEARLLQTQRLESVGRLASGIAHDLNNILSPVLVAPDLLRQVVDDPRMLELLDSMEASAQRGATIVRQLLAFGRGADASRSPVSIQPLIKEMNRMMGETFPRNISRRLELWPEPLIVEGDSTQMYQLLMNLCVNARDAMPDGGDLVITLDRVEVTDAQCSAYSWTHPGPHARLTVTDHGCGIPSDLQGKIFDPFFTTKPAGHGTGLGLSTAMGITRSHRGFIELTSVVGKGTTFRVYLPLADAGVEVPAVDGVTSAPPGAGESILLTDDEEGIRKVLGEVLRRSGYEVLVASNGAEALKVLNQRAGKIRVLITDMVMPVMDGWSLIQQVRTAWPSIKIVAISGNLPDAQWSDQLRAAVDAVMLKPCGKKSLLQTVRDVLDAPDRPAH